MVTRDRFRTGPAPLNGGSTSGKVRWAHMPEKSGIDAVLLTRLLRERWR